VAVWAVSVAIKQQQNIDIIYDNNLRLIINICSYENIPHSIFNQSACVSL